MSALVVGRFRGTGKGKGKGKEGRKEGRTRGVEGFRRMQMKESITHGTSNIEKQHGTQQYSTLVNKSICAACASQAS